MPATAWRLPCPCCGKARAFVCPYHAWTYDSQGKLLGVTDRAGFAGLDLGPRIPIAIAATSRLGHIRAGREKAGLGMEGFDIVPTVPVIIGDDIEACAEPVRAYCALYIGGMGSREKNFYNALAVRMGFGDAAAQIQDLYLAKDYAGAAAAVPLEFIQRTSLIGPPDVIAERLKDYAAAGVTTLSIASYYDTLGKRMETVRLMRIIKEDAVLFYARRAKIVRGTA